MYSQVSLGYATVRVRKSRISVSEFVSFIHENEPTQQFFPRVKVAELAENDDQGNSNCCGWQCYIFNIISLSWTETGTSDIIPALH